MLSCFAIAVAVYLQSLRSYKKVKCHIPRTLKAMIDRMDSKYKSRITWGIEMLKRDSPSSNMTEDELIDRALWYEILNYNGQGMIDAITAAKEHKSSLIADHANMFFLAAALVWVPLRAYWDIAPLVLSAASFWHNLRNMEGDEKLRQLIETYCSQFSVLMFALVYGSYSPFHLSVIMPVFYVLYMTLVYKHVKDERQEPTQTLAGIGPDKEIEPNDDGYQ